jgi:hypothetical protein
MLTMPSVETMLLAGRAIFLVFSFILAAVTFTAWRRATRQQTEQVLAQSEALQQRLRVIEEHLVASAGAITRLDERIERQSQQGNAPGYQIAIRMARGGASREELMSSCGLTLSEADLVRRLHGSNGTVN